MTASAPAALGVAASAPAAARLAVAGAPAAAPATGAAHLLHTRRFLPLLVTQTLGAVNDNLFKNALVVLALFQAGEHGPLLLALAGGVFILPYILFSALAGQVADRGEKARLIRATKLWEVGLMGLAALGFLTGSMALLMAVLFGLGLQSAFFSPLKYSILPDHLGKPELVAGNGLIETGIFLGILAGTIAGGALMLLENGGAVVSAAGLAVAAAGLVASFGVPRAPAADPGLRLAWNVPRATWALIREARGNRPVWLAILGLSWFWTIGATLLVAFPLIARDTLGAVGAVAALPLAVFALGISAGSLACARILAGEISPRLVPWAALGITLFTADIAIAALSAAGDPRMATLEGMLAAPLGWRILADLFLVAVCGGLYSVPLYAIVQERSPAALRARMVAANNVANAAWMAMGAGAAAALAALGADAPSVLLIAAAVNLGVALRIAGTIPQETMRAALRFYLRLFHRFEVRGLEHYRAAGDNAILVANHLSLVDGALIAAAVPDRPSFVVNTFMARKWWARPFLALVRTFEVDPSSPYAFKSMVRAVREDGRKLVIFPEGRVSRTGALMKIYEGAGMLAERTGVPVLPVRLDGPQYSRFAYTKGVLRRRWFPRVTVTFLPPVRIAAPEGVRGRARRRALSDALDSVMSEAAFRTAETGRSLFAALLDARVIHGGRAKVLDDPDFAALSFNRIVLGAAVLGRRLAGIAAPGERIGVMLPNAKGTAVTFFALQAIGRVPAMMNFSAGADGMLAACRAAEIRTVLCSRRFVERGKLGPAVARMEEAGLRFVWLEDIRAAIGLGARLRGLLDARLARRLPGACVAADAPAVVLFTSGSEGTPKGVVLSHRNILANCAQLAAVLDFNSADRVVNALPMFHSFGLTGGTLLPLLNGVPSFLYPSPLHYRMVPEVIYDRDATIVFGTDTFLNGWARYAHPYDFRAVRLIFAGAEKLRDETRRLYADRFGKGMLEGYGATETAPVLCVNTPKRNRVGTVGLFLPGIEHRIEPVPGLDDQGAGRLWVRGPNVMLGYLRVEAPGVLQPPPGGWYDTGDIVSVDGDGFVTIRGRAKRFAKIGGEMVSMAAAEALAGALWPDAAHAVLPLPDPRKGERLVLLTTSHDATVTALLALARERGVPELAVPRELLVIERMPLLGTGKVDYPAAQRLLAERLGAAEQRAVPAGVPGPR
jgi:acyl-[acyl-carrier-protein]-phospholipid O-acyltransferase/long-chain-fatty-acid--[acyl-carrier-protein] ligase